VAREALSHVAREAFSQVEREAFSRAVTAVDSGSAAVDRSPERLALRVLEELDRHHVSGKQLHVSGDRLTLVVSRENLHEEPRVRAALAARFGDDVRIADTLGALSVVGAGINASFENVRRGSAALSAHGIGIDGLATSSFRITWMIDRARLDDAVRLMHASFVEQRRDSGSEPIPNP
jgi:aspartate kinase